MGHVLSSRSTLIPPTDRLNRYPIGPVDSEKLREILSILFSEQEAFVAFCVQPDKKAAEYFHSTTGCGGRIISLRTASFVSHWVLVSSAYLI